MTAIEPALIEKLKQLPPHKVAEVEDFVEFLRTREDDRRLTQAASKRPKQALRGSGTMMRMRPMIDCNRLPREREEQP